MRKRFVTLLLTAAMAASMLAGCGSSASESTTAAEADTEAASSEKAADTDAEDTEAASDTASADNSDKTIYVIVKVLGNQYWSVLQAGAEKAGEDLGCNVVVVGTALESDIEGQLTLLQNAVSAQADGIVIAPLDSVSLDAPITEAYNSGTPVVLD